MAIRPVFLPVVNETARFVREALVEFAWSPGLASSQKLKSVRALHAAAALRGFSPLLEVSTKSELETGRLLSAFNLPVALDDGSQVSLECAFQGSKVFERGGPYRDLLGRSSREAKQDERLRTSGRVVGFSLEGREFPAEPKTAFYDWLYLRALAPHPDYVGVLVEYAGFTDIEFNPRKAINCQARACALIVALSRRSLLAEAIAAPAKFIDLVSRDALAQPHSDDLRQQKLL